MDWAILGGILAVNVVVGRGGGHPANGRLALVAGYFGWHRAAGEASGEAGLFRESGRDLERTRGVCMQTGHCSARRVHPFRSFSPMPVDTLLLFD